jgi:hypothetical protein
MADMYRLAKSVVIGNMQPKSFGSGETAICACFVAMQAGAEMGLPPMMAIQNIAVINGKPGIYGPAALALVQASGKLEEIDERLEGDGDKRQAVILVKRAGQKARAFTFSVSDAKRASLWEKAGPWKQYPDRMLLARCRGFALRDVFPDVLLGVTHTIEELTNGDAEEVGQLPRATVVQQEHNSAKAPGLAEFIDSAEVRESAADKDDE